MKHQFFPETGSFPGRARDGPGVVQTDAILFNMNLMLQKFSSIKYDSENEWGLLRSKIYSIEATGNDFLWVATDYGLEYLSSDGIRYDDISKSELGVNQITDIYFGDSNILWIGSTSGLLKIDLNDHSVFRYSSKSVDENHKITNDIFISYCYWSTGSNLLFK